MSGILCGETFHTGAQYYHPVMYNLRLYFIIEYTVSVFLVNAAYQMADDWCRNCDDPNLSCGIIVRDAGTVVVKLIV